MRGRRLVNLLITPFLLLGTLCIFPVSAAQESQVPRIDRIALPITDSGPTRLFRQGPSSYPRLIRLRHAGLVANGRILASMTTYVDNAGRAVIYESDDEGSSFRQIGEIRDPASDNRQGVCCSTLYELPITVGDMPAGTLLWAGTVGIGMDVTHRRSRIRLWRSDDHGHSWNYLSDVAVAPRGRGIWEPELAVDKRGELVTFYADETDRAHDQQIVQRRSPDGRTWSEPLPTVRLTQYAARPGMPGVRLLPDGSYVMTYEICNYDRLHQCAAYVRTSTDGTDFGDPGGPGSPIVSDTRTHPMHTPTLTWEPWPAPKGRLLLGYQMLGADDGSIAPGNGKTLLINDDPSHPDRGWREVTAPVEIKDAGDDVCRNFSPAVLAARGGQFVLHITTDRADSQPCQAFFRRGPLPASTESADLPVP